MDAAVPERRSGRPGPWPSSSDEAPRRAGAIARWWFAPVRRGVPWRVWLVTFTGLLAAPLWFAVGTAVAGLAVVAAVTVVGLALVPPLLTGLAKAAGLERLRAALVGPPIPPRPLATGPLLVRLTDRARWRPLVGVLAGLFVWIGLFVALVVTWSVLVSLLTVPLWGWSTALSWIQIAALAALGAMSVGLAFRATSGIGWIGHRFATWAFGPDPTAALQERVDTLAESRQEILDAVADERRRIERNLHDGVQQGLVAMGIDMSLAARLIEQDPDAARALIEQAQDKARASIGELRLLGRGLHPAILGDRGLDAALSSVVAGSTVPMTLTYDVSAELHADIAEAAYFVVNEAVSNVLKHAEARTASVGVTEAGNTIVVTVDDDGGGGADPSGGTGLVGLSARVRAVDGRLDVDSPPGGPTSIRAVLPLRTVDS